MQKMQGTSFLLELQVLRRGNSHDALEAFGIVIDVGKAAASRDLSDGNVGCG